MYLKSLTLKGFKSFASSTTLQLEPGITCIVGPNGSGKSNVVDALAWVMGEQGAKSLRGGKMEDVIFAGTSGRSPLGRAEVLLTIDNSDGALPIEYAEVTISRTMFRSGGSEYAINGTACRLLDVQELLSDSGIGREMHVIVGQGQLDTILHATPEDRRGFIEEAAGVLKHRKRKEKALRKLDSTDGNLTRLGDLLSEIRRQLKPLGRQAEVARKAAAVQADARDARARLVAADLVTARTALEQELADETILVERRAEVETALAQAREAEAALEAALREDLPALSAAQETWFALSGVRERLRGTQSLAAERVRNAASTDGGRAGHRTRPRRPSRPRRPGSSEQERAIGAEVDGLRTALEEALAAKRAAEDAAAEEERRVAGLLGPRRTVARGWPACTARSMRSVRAPRPPTTRWAGSGRPARPPSLVPTARSATSPPWRPGSPGWTRGRRDSTPSTRPPRPPSTTSTTGWPRSGRRPSRRTGTGPPLAARRDALEMGLNRKDGAGALLAASDDVSGLLGSVAALLTVRPGFEAALARCPRKRRRRGRGARPRGRRRRPGAPQDRRPRARRSAARRRRAERRRLARPARRGDVRRRRGGGARRPAGRALEAALQGRGRVRPRRCPRPRRRAAGRHRGHPRR